MNRSGRILVVDDEVEVAELIGAAAEELGMRWVSTTNAGSLPEMLTHDVSLILLDLMMPDMDGVEALRLLSDLQCRAGIVLMSGISHRVLETAEKLARTLGLVVVGHLSKPFELAELEAVLLQHQAPISPVAAKPASRATVSEEALRAAIARNEFVVHYQPLIELSSGAVVCVEALARWQHSERGLIYPDQFISRIEELGLIDELGALIADRALAEVPQFAGMGLAAPRLALNVSVQSLRELKFPDSFAKLLRKHKTPADAVILEITESGLINELANTLDVLTRLRVKGIQLSIDDFGTGYAMMEQLVNIPATELKIDRTFVSNMLANSSDRIMVQKSIEIGHELGMKVIAEGVETEQQLNFLRKEGCDVAQGYLFSRPLPPDEFAVWIGEYRSRVALSV